LLRDPWDLRIGYEQLEQSDGFWGALRTYVFSAPKIIKLWGLQNPRMIFSEKGRTAPFLRKNHPLNQQCQTL
jgi:hypothetical protein